MQCVCQGHGLGGVGPGGLGQVLGLFIIVVYL